MPENKRSRFSIPDGMVPIFAGLYAWQVGGWISAVVAYVGAIVLIAGLIALAQREHWPLRRYLRVRLVCLVACVIPVAMGGAEICDMAAATCTRFIY